MQWKQDCWNGGGLSLRRYVMTTLIHLMEFIYGPDDTATHPKDGNYRQLGLHPTFGRWW
jgi:hypothetical protein